MKNFKSILFALLVSSFVFTSCINDKEIIGADITAGPTIVGWANPSVTESYFSDIGTLNNTYPVSVLSTGNGDPTTSAITVNLTVDASTTATDGGEFSIPSASFSIPAGGTFAGVPVDINTGSFNPTQPTKLVLNITASADGVVISDFAKQMTINFVGCQSQLASSNYMVTITRDDGRTYGPVLESVVMESVNNFLTASVGTWNPPLNPGHGIRFEDICGTLHMADQELADMYSNKVASVGDGAVDANGNFSITYKISFGSGDRTYAASYVKQ